MRNFLICGTVIALLLGGGWYAYSKFGSLEPARDAKGFPPEVARVIAQKHAALDQLMQDAAFIAEVRASNEKNGSLSSEDIARLDDEWKESTTTTPFIKSFLENATADKFHSFQRSHPEFREIFVADVHGLNVGQTDKTSDYYQADEDWWVDSYDGGAGKVLNGQIEFDESAQVEAISLYRPVIDPASRKAIGVLKAVVDLDSIKEDLRHI